MTIEFTPDEISALAAALEAFDAIPPVVPDIEPYLTGAQKIADAAEAL